MMWEDPDIVVDISETIEFKIAARAGHVSQMPNRIALDANVRERAARLGRLKGLRCAEAFVCLTGAADCGTTIRAR